MPEALPELVPLALEFFIFAVVWSIRILLGALLGVIASALTSAHIPFVGDAITGAVRSAEQAVDHALGRVEHGIGSLIGATWHRFAQLNRWLWHEFTQHSLIYWLLSQSVAELTHGYHYLHGRVSDLTDSHAGNTARIKSLEREYRGIEAQVKTLEREYSHGIGHDVLPRLKTLEREAANIENVQLPAAIAAQRQADSAISDLYSWAKGKAALLGVGTFAAAVAVALGSLGLGNLRCPAFLRVLGRPNCGLGNALESLLGWFVDLFIITDLCEVIPLLETAYADVAAPAVALLTEAIDAMPCVDGNQAPALTVPRLYLPANPGFALSLP